MASGGERAVSSKESMFRKIKDFVVGYVFGPTRVAGRFVWNQTYGRLRRRLDDPELVLEDTLGRMEEEVREAREGVVQSMVDEKKLARSADESRAQADAWRQKARAFVAAGDDAKAREALARQREAEELAKLRATELARLRDRVVQLKAQVDLMGRKLEEAKRMKGRFLAQMRQHKSGQGPDPFEEFRKIEEKISELEVRAEVERELAPSPALPASETPLLPPADVDDELEKLRKEIGSK